MRRGAVIATAIASSIACSAIAQQTHLPRNLTEAERSLLLEHPLVATRGGSVPTGPLWCPPEYAPTEAIILTWEGYTSWKNILAEMAANFTLLGDADVYIALDSSGGIPSAESRLRSFGTDMSRVRFFVKPMNTIWVRDYGPRFVYENGVRVIVDHTYNRPRPNDNDLPDFLASQLGFDSYDIPLIHGGGNFHLSGLADSHATRLIANENPGLTEEEIIGYWAQYQGLETTIHTPFRSGIDSTQHIDMWMIPVGDREVIISDWPLAPGSYEDNICDSTAVMLAGMGYEVHRVPAVHTSGTHYTFTNAVICNGVVCLPSYTNNIARQYNAEALSVWEQALPEKTIVQINSQPIVTAAGVLHCIVMHVPRASDGENPTIYMRSLNEAATLEPGEQVELEWIADDDVDTYYVKLELSLDGGESWPIVIDAFEPDDGVFTWTVPDVGTTRGRVRGVIYDWDHNTGIDITDGDLTITGDGGCVADFNGDGRVDTQDVLAFLNAWTAGDASADINGDGSVNTQDVIAFLNAWTNGC